MESNHPTDATASALRVDDAPFVVASMMFAAYCNALDTGSPEALRHLLADDAVLELGDATHEGADAFVASYAGFFASTGRTTRHHVTNVRVIERGTQITAEAYLLAVTSRDGSLSLASGSYRDVFVVVGDQWRIARKRIELAIPFTRVTPRAPS